MHEQSKEYLDLLETREPLTYKACYPKRIVPPQGYTNPKYYALQLRSQIMAATMPQLNQLPHYAGFLNVCKQLEYGVPTYFVQRYFAEAVGRTRPPEDFKISELKWPLDAMVFVLPLEFTKKFFGAEIPYISIVRAAKGTYPQAGKLPKLDYMGEPMKALENQADRCVIHFTHAVAGTEPVVYSTVFNDNSNIGDMKSFRLKDATAMESAELDAPVIASEFSDQDEEKKFIDAVMLFSLGIMLAMTARPQLVEHGVQERKEKRDSNGEVVRDALWSANKIGWKYTLSRESAPHGGATGTHASPRMHWRFGHMRNQPYGPNNSLRKLIWIDAVLVGQ